MEVTNENFEAIYPDMVKKIEECTFCSIDCELSGVTQYKDLNSFDTPKSRYDRLKKNEQNYLIIQFGLCVFKYDEEKKSYDTTAYNCFLFPRTRNCRYSTDYNFGSLNSSIEFLCEQNFDFNKMFKQGVSFISKDVEESVRQRVKQTMENRDKPKTTIYPTNSSNKEKDIKGQIDNIMKEIDEFAENEQETKKEIKFSDFLLRVYTEKNIKQKYFNRLRYEHKPIENKERLMTITKVDPKNAINELETLEKEIGFSRIIWLLSKSQKLIVGHNMLTDVMQMIRQFFCSQLPDNFEDFKSMTRTIFPKLLDTKYMANVAPLKEIITATALGDMEKIVSKEPFPEIVLENCEYSTKEEKLHEAGYDAYLTGYCFARMLHYLETFNSSRKALEDFYSNKLYLMKSYDLSFIDLNAPQEEPKRDNVFYLEFPSSWENQDIFDLFSPFGSVHIGWNNDTSAFVAIHNQDNVKKAASQLVGVSGREYKCYFYSTYVNRLSKPKPVTNQPVGNTASERPTKNGAASTPSTPTAGGDKRKLEAVKTPNEDEQEINGKKKIRKEENGDVSDPLPIPTEPKPFEECADW